MARLLLVLTTCLLMSANIVFGCDPYQPSQRPDNCDTAEVKSARAHASDLKKALAQGKLITVANKADLAIENLVTFGVAKLRAAGDTEGAYYHEHIFETNFKGFLTRLQTARDNGRDIGDHKPLVEWLATFYDRLEFILGVGVCKATHLSDIKTFNFCIPVVFKPCTFPMDGVTGERSDEYKRHFAEGDVYYGLLPVTVYWLAEVPCLMAGGAIVCGIVSGGAEYLVAKFVAPKVSDRVFERACE